MEYVKLFDTHSKYAEYANGGTMLKPNVSHCVQENEVHYNPIQVVPLEGNEEAFELFSQYVCDDAKIDEYLKNVFSKYEVTVNMNHSASVGMLPFDTFNAIQMRYVDPSKAGSDSMYAYSAIIILKELLENESGTEYTLKTNECGASLYDWYETDYMNAA